MFAVDAMHCECLIMGWSVAYSTLTLPFSQHCCFENQLVPHAEVCNLQVLQQLIHNVSHVLVVAHGEEQVQTTPPDADVSILQRGHNALLMPVSKHDNSALHILHARQCQTCMLGCLNHECNMPNTLKS